MMMIDDDDDENEIVCPSFSSFFLFFAPLALLAPFSLQKQKNTSSLDLRNTFLGDKRGERRERREKQKKRERESRYKNLLLLYYIYS